MKFIDIIKENDYEGKSIDWILDRECEKKIKSAKNVFQIIKNGEIVHAVDGSVLKYEFTGHAKYKCNKHPEIEGSYSNKIFIFPTIETHHGVSFPFDVYIDNVKQDVNSYDLGRKRQLFYNICDNMNMKLKKFNLHLAHKMH
jgi:hypothetical protein